jgi:hypothetical protein
MDENPYQSPTASQEKAPSKELETISENRSAVAWLCAAVAVFLGLPVGWFAVVTGAHAGEAWPTITLCAPVYLVATTVGDNLGYVAIMVFGTGLLYGAYARLLVGQVFIKGLLIVTCMHGGAMLIVSYMFFM